MSLAGFVEERLELCIDYGAEGGPEFDTGVVSQRSGQDYRNINWPESKGNWNIGDRVVTKTELENIYNFFQRRRGAAIGFRWKDWSDYELNKQIALAVNPVEYQIQKTYGARDEHAYTVNILKPVSSTIKVYVNGVQLVAGLAISSTTGILKFDEPPVGEVTVDGEFDKRVRFNVDTFNIQFNAYDEFTNEALYTITGIPVIELRE